MRTAIATLSVLAALAGLSMASWGSKALVVFAPVAMRGLADTSIDARLLAFSVGLSVITALLFGILPALHASKVDLNSALKQSAHKFNERSKDFTDKCMMVFRVPQLSQIEFRSELK